MIHLGKPEGNLEDYYKHKINGIIVYNIKSIKLVDNELNIDLSRLFKWKKLHIEGALVRK